MRKEAANTWSDGLIMDLNPISTPNSALTDCLNGTFLTYDGNELALQNDRGNYNLKGSELSEDFVPVGIASYGDILYVLSYNPILNRSEIGSYPSPNTSISEDLDNTLNVESILAQAFRYDQNQPYWTKQELEDKYQKDFIFYGVSNDLTINPGDSYTITDIPDSQKYEKLSYSIFSNSETYKVDPIIGEGDHKVSWEVAGYLKCKFELPTTEELHIYPLTINKPSKRLNDDGTWSLNNESLTFGFSASFQSNDPLVKEAKKNGDVYLKCELTYGTDKQTVIINDFNESIYSSTTTYSSKPQNVVFNFGIDPRTGVNKYDTLSINTELIINAKTNEETPLVHPIIFDSTSYELSIENATQSMNVTLAEDYFQYTYDYDTKKLHISTDIELTSLPGNDFEINAKLKYLGKEEGELEVKSIEYSGPKLTSCIEYKESCLTFDWPDELDPDFYAIKFTVTDLNPDTEEIEPLLTTERFIIADELVNSYFSERNLAPAEYKRFDELPASVLLSGIQFIPTGSITNTRIDTSESLNTAVDSTNNSTLEKYLKKDANYYELIGEDISRIPIDVNQSCKGTLVGNVELSWTSNCDLINQQFELETDSYESDKIPSVNVSRTVKCTAGDCQQISYRKSVFRNLAGTNPSERAGILLNRKNKDEDYSKNMKDGDTTYATKNAAAKNLYKIHVPWDNTSDHWANGSWSKSQSFGDVSMKLMDYWESNFKGGLGYINLGLLCQDRKDSSEGITSDSLIFGPVNCGEDISKYVETTLLVGKESGENGPFLYPVYSSSNGNDFCTSKLNRIQEVIVDENGEEVVGYYLPSVTLETPANSTAAGSKSYKLQNGYYKNDTLCGIDSTGFNSALIQKIEDILLEESDCQNLREFSIPSAVLSVSQEGTFDAPFNNLENIINRNINEITQNLDRCNITHNTIYYNIYPKPNSDFFRGNISELGTYHFNSNLCFNNLGTSVAPCQSYIKANGSKEGKKITWGKSTWHSTGHKFLDIVLNEDYSDKILFKKIAIYDLKNVQEGYWTKITGSPKYQSCPFQVSTNFIEGTRYLFTKEEAASLAAEVNFPIYAYIEGSREVKVFVPWDYCKDWKCYEKIKGSYSYCFYSLIYVTNLPEGLPVIISYSDRGTTEGNVKTHCFERTIIGKNNEDTNFQSQVLNSIVLPKYQQYDLIKSVGTPPSSVSASKAPIAEKKYGVVGDYRYRRYAGIEEIDLTKSVTTIKVDWEKLAEKGSNSSVKSLYCTTYSELPSYNLAVEWD